MTQSKVLILSGARPVARDIVSAVFERRGHIVDSKTVGQEALVGLAAYDLVVLEIDGTDPDAFLLCHRIRQVSHVPLLVLLPPASSSQGVRALELGADGYIVMPVDRRELAARSEAMLRRYRRF